ncbi:MAG: LLM class flavin-dependent oxidoreductase [Acidimicrobiia bacterium]|nr:LLM class flavin-dependent oxidoreductase [Acidimicrobiia bacterium]
MQVGVNLPQYDVDFSAGRAVAASTLAYAQHAEDLGFDSVWVSDHPWVAGPDGSISGALDPIALLGAIAAVTSHVRVGSLVLAASLLDEPTVAELARSLRLLCPDRATLGLGTGWNPVIHTAYGVSLVDYADRVAHLADLARAARLDGGPEVLVGGWGTDVLDVARELADAWNVAWDVPAHAFRSLTARLAAPAASPCRTRPPLRCSVGLTVLVAATPQAVTRAVDVLRGRAPFLRDLDTDTLTARAVVGNAATCAHRILDYGADEVVIAPFLRDDLSYLETIGEDLLPVLQATRA